MKKNVYFFNYPAVFGWRHKNYGSEPLLIINLPEAQERTLKSQAPPLVLLPGDEGLSSCTSNSGFTFTYCGIDILRY